MRVRVNQVGMLVNVWSCMSAFVFRVTCVWSSRISVSSECTLLITSHEMVVAGLVNEKSYNGKLWIAGAPSRCMRGEEGYSRRAQWSAPLAGSKGTLCSKRTTGRCGWPRLSQ